MPAPSSGLGQEPGPGRTTAGPSQPTLELPMPAAGKLQLGFCRASPRWLPQRPCPAHLWPHPFSISCPQQLLTPPSQPQPFRRAALKGGWQGCRWGSVFGPCLLLLAGLAGGRGAPQGCSQDETQDGQRWAACPALRGLSAPLRTPGCADGPAERRFAAGTPRVCSGEGGEDVAPRERGRRWAEGAETQFLSAGDGEGGSQTPPPSRELVGKGEHPRHLRMEPQAQGSPGGPAAEGTGRRKGGLWPHHGGQMLP